MKFDELLYKKMPTYVSILIFLFALILVMLFAGCTVSLNNTQASGRAQESISEQQRASAQATVPMGG